MVFGRLRDDDSSGRDIKGAVWSDGNEGAREGLNAKGLDTPMLAPLNKCRSCYSDLHIASF